MHVPAKLRARLKHDMVEQAALAVHLFRPAQELVHLDLARAAEHLLAVDGNLIAASYE